MNGRYRQTSRLFLMVLIIAGIWMSWGVRPVSGQGIGFDIPDDDERYALRLTSLAGYEELNFGNVLGGFTYDIALDSEDLVILEIRGVRYLDVFVTLDPDPDLYLFNDPSHTIPLTINGGFANQGEGNIGPGFRKPFSGTMVRFPLFRRSSGPPGPPPVPPHSGYSPPRESAYLYIYGSIDVPQNVPAGDYEGTISVVVEYDL